MTTTTSKENTMTNADLLAALKNVPASGSAAIRTVPYETLSYLGENARRVVDETNSAHWRLAEQLRIEAGLMTGWDAGQKHGFSSPAFEENEKALKALVEKAKEQYDAAHPVEAELCIVAGRGWRNGDGASAAISRELHRRRMLENKKNNASARAANAVAAGTYAVGDKVQVHAFGHWYNGEVTKLGRTGKVTVRYTSGTGTVREKAVGQDKVQKAA